MAVLWATRRTHDANGALAGPVVVELGQELREDLLRDVLGVAVADDPRDVGVHGPRVADVQLAHGLAVAQAGGGGDASHMVFALSATRPRRLSEWCMREGMRWAAPIRSQDASPVGFRSNVPPAVRPRPPKLESCTLGRAHLDDLRLDVKILWPGRSLG